MALTEEGTRLPDAHHGVSDETWAQVRRHYDDDAPREPVQSCPTSDTCQHHSEDARQHLTMTTAGGDAQEWV